MIKTHRLKGKELVDRLKTLSKPINEEVVSIKTPTPLHNRINKPPKNNMLPIKSNSKKDTHTKDEIDLELEDLIKELELEIELQEILDEMGYLGDD